MKHPEKAGVQSASRRAVVRAEGRRLSARRLDVTRLATFQSHPTAFFFSPEPTPNPSLFAESTVLEVIGMVKLAAFSVCLSAAGGWDPVGAQTHFRYTSPCVEIRSSSEAIMGEAGLLFVDKLPSKLRCRNTPENTPQPR